MAPPTSAKIQMKSTLKPCPAVRAFARRPRSRPSPGTRGSGSARSARPGRRGRARTGAREYARPVQRSTGSPARRQYERHIRRTPGSADRLRRMSDAASLALILPAFDEEARLGPALDELFGYLGPTRRRRRATARPGPPTPGRIDVLVVDDGSTDGTAALVRRARDRGRRSGRHDAAPAVRSARRQGRSGPGRDARRATADLIVFADADMATPPDQLPLLVAGARPTTTSRSGRGSSPTGRTCARASRGIGGCSARLFHSSRRSGSSARSRTRSAASRASRGPRPRTCSRAQQIRSIVFDVELIYLARRPRLSDRDRPDPLVRQARFADARATRTRAARRVGSLPDPAAPSRSRQRGSLAERWT